MPSKAKYPPVIPGTKFAPKLPELPYVGTPNMSRRNPIAWNNPFKAPFLIVAHRPVGGFEPSINWLRNPVSEASAHVITEGRHTGVDIATQLVPWDMKAWTQGSFNSLSYGIEIDDDAWDGDDFGALLTACRVFAYICVRTRIPCVWTRRPLDQPGITRHYDLGAAGGGHTDPTTDPKLWAWTIKQTQKEIDRGGFRKVWGRGEFHKIHPKRKNTSCCKQ